jgi:hypothetical protein
MNIKSWFSKKGKVSEGEIQETETLEENFVFNRTKGHEGIRELKEGDLFEEETQKGKKVRKKVLKREEVNGLVFVYSVEVD